MSPDTSYVAASALREFTAKVLAFLQTEADDLGVPMPALSPTSLGAGA